MTSSKGYYSLRKKILINLISGGSVLVMVIVTSSFMKYYTDVIGLSPAIYGVVFLLFSIWNGINDPLIGYWADQRPFLTGRGKYRPLIRWAIPIMGLSVISLLFASPDWNEALIAIFLLVLLVIYEAAQTLLGVSFMAFTVNTFLPMGERTERRSGGHVAWGWPWRAWQRRPWPSELRRGAPWPSEPSQYQQSSWARPVRDEALGLTAGYQRPAPP